MIDALQNYVGIYVATFVIAALSGVIPLINIEIYLVAVCVAIGQVPAAIAIGILAAAGQMIAKSGIYRAARGATDLGAKHSKHAAKIERARQKVERYGKKPHVLTFVSAAVGLPPFFIYSIVAGMVAMDFRAFFVVGLAGRIVRFATIAVIAAVA